MRRPRVITFNVASLDGRLTIAPGVQLLFGDQRWHAIAGQGDPYQWVRAVHDPDVLLEGSGSFVAQDAPPIDYPADEGEATGLVAHHLPADVVDAPDRRWMAIVDGQGRVQLQFTEWPDPAWAAWHALVVTSRAVTPAHLAWLRTAGIPYLVAGDGPVDLAEALELFHDELGVHTLVSTAGGRLNAALLRAGVVDEVDVELLPAVIGGRGTPALFDAPPLGPTELPVRLELLDSEITDDGHVRLRYTVQPS
jgi:2,5-diamino-6-(ribosylamino)-4(3H)-pyrimidinone 5'-phosphate reductase